MAFVCWAMLTHNTLALRPIDLGLCCSRDPAFIVHFFNESLTTNLRKGSKNSAGPDLIEGNARQWHGAALIGSPCTYIHTYISSHKKWLTFYSSHCLDSTFGVSWELGAIGPECWQVELHMAETQAGGDEVGLVVEIDEWKSGHHLVKPPWKQTQFLKSWICLCFYFSFFWPFWVFY